MRKEYDLRSLKVKRRGELAAKAGKKTPGTSNGKGTRSTKPRHGR